MVVWPRKRRFAVLEGETLADRIDALRAEANRRWSMAALSAALAVGAVLTELDIGFHHPHHTAAMLTAERVGAIIFGTGTAGMAVYLGHQGTQAGREAAALIITERQ